MAEDGPTQYQIQDLILDIGLRQVKRGEESLQLGGLTFDLLRVLVESAPGIVTHDELAEKVWSGRPVSPETITQRAMMLRQALDDHAENPKYFEVIRGHGFRLIPEVVAGKRDQKQKSRRTAVALLSALVIVAVAIFAIYQFESGNEDNVLPNSVAVLPFENLSLNPEDAFFAAGIHDEVLSRLANLNSLNVIARTSMMRYANTQKDIPQIAAELNVETVMEGSVRYANGRVLVTAQLIDPLTNVHLWSESYNREFSDIFSIQADIATKIAGALEAQFSLAEQESIERQPTESMEAYALYLKGLQLAFPRLERLEDLNNAISIDPEFGLAYALRAYIRAGTIRFSQTETEFLELDRLIREDAQRALSLDSAATMAYVAVARLDEALWRGASARTGYQRALEVKPNDPEVLIHYASLLRNLGALDEALAMGRRASWLDPASLVPTHQMGHIYFAVQDFDNALSAYEIVRTTPPTNSGASILMAYISAIHGKPEDARRHLEFAEEMTRPAIWAFQAPRIALGYARAGHVDDAHRMFAEVERLHEESPLGDAAWAIAYMAVNDYERALVRLNSAIDTRRPSDFVLLTEIKANLFQDPILDTDPRFLQARAKLVFNE